MFYQGYQNLFLRCFGNSKMCITKTSVLICNICRHLCVCPETFSTSLYIDVPTYLLHSLSCCEMITHNKTMVLCFLFQKLFLVYRYFLLISTRDISLLFIALASFVYLRICVFYLFLKVSIFFPIIRK